MGLVNCRKCGKMFNYIAGEPVCPICKEKAEEQFQRVKKYVEDNRTATINEIVENCEVEAKQIKQWIREERLVFSENSPIKINCETCGAQILTGRYCSKCMKNTANVFENASQRPNRPSSQGDSGSGSNKRMYTLKG